MILHEIFRVVSHFPTTFFVLYLGKSITFGTVCTVPKEIDFPRYNMKCSRKNVILRGIVHVVSCFPLHFMLYRRNLDCFSNRVDSEIYVVF